MKQIILMRHAKVDIDNSEKIGSLALQNWIEVYDNAPIDKKSLPSSTTVALVKSADVIVTSTLRRAIDSAKVLDVVVAEENMLFNEAAIPEVNIPFIKLTPKSWLMILRTLLLLGLGKKDTSLKASKIQANKAALRLVEYSKEHENVVLVGHGGMNWLISKALMKQEWELDAKPSSSHWGVRVLRCIT